MAVRLCVPLHARRKGPYADAAHSLHPLELVSRSDGPSWQKAEAKHATDHLATCAHTVGATALELPEGRFKANESRNNSLRHAPASTKQLCGQPNSLIMFSNNVTQGVQEHYVCMPNQHACRTLNGATHGAPSTNTGMPCPNNAEAKMATVLPTQRAMLPNGPTTRDGKMANLAWAVFLACAARCCLGCHQLHRPKMHDAAKTPPHRCCWRIGICMQPSKPFPLRNKAPAGSLQWHARWPHLRDPINAFDLVGDLDSGVALPQAHLPRQSPSRVSDTLPPHLNGTETAHFAAAFSIPQAACVNNLLAQADATHEYVRRRPCLRRGHLQSKSQSERLV